MKVLCSYLKYFAVLVLKCLGLTTFQNLAFTIYHPYVSLFSEVAQCDRLFLGCTVTQLNNNSKTIQCMKSRKYDVIGDK